MKKIIILFVVLGGFAASSFGQATATATSTATIVTPISIGKDVDMNFGNVAVKAAGTVVLPANSAPTRTYTGGITFPNVTGTVAAAQFTVSGQNDYTYSISLPSTLTLTRASGTETMVVDNFVSTPTVTDAGTLSGTGSQILYVGATLNVGAAQAAGVYQNPTGFNVTVNYN
jgi:hypothetical protein